MRTLKSIIALAAALAVSAPAFAQKIEERKEAQQKRIADGIQSGQLTPGETKNLESKEQKLNQQVRAERQANGGKLTSAEKQQINKEQNQISKDINKDKHNVQKQNFKGEVGERQSSQQQRIAQGVQSGQLTAGETKRLEAQQQKINQEVKADRQANGGKLTPAERAQVNGQQNQASKRIYKAKHNAQTGVRAQ